MYFAHFAAAHASQTITPNMRNAARFAWTINAAKHIARNTNTHASAFTSTTVLT